MKCAIAKFRRVLFAVLILSQVVPVHVLGAPIRSMSGSMDCDGAAHGSFRCRGADDVRVGNDRPNLRNNSRSYRDAEKIASTVIYQVHVVGAVQYPGTYDVQASSRLQGALQQAGGIVDNGSKRRIQVRHADRTKQRFDLLQFQLHGDLRHNPYLLDGDVVHVPLRKDVVEISGAVRRPDEYELGSDRSLAALVKLAGGVSSGVAREVPVKIVRYVDSEKRVLSVNHDQRAQKKFQLRAGDVVVVHDVVTATHEFDYNSVSIPGTRPFYPSYEDRVFVLGGVSMPGAYDFNPFYTPEQYISMAGGMTPLAKKRKIQVIDAAGKKSKYHIGKSDQQINPGDTVYIKESRVPPETWARIVLGLASTALGITTSIIALSRL